MYCLFFVLFSLGMMFTLVTMVTKLFKAMYDRYNHFIVVDLTCKVGFVHKVVKNKLMNKFNKPENNHSLDCLFEQINTIALPNAQSSLKAY